MVYPDYDPNDAEAPGGNVWPESDYQLAIEDIELTTSQSSGDPMIKFTFKVFDDAGNREKLLWDYITPKINWKLKSIADAAGLSKEFETGKFNPDDYMGANLTAHIAIEKSDKYGDQNKIKYYLEPEANAIVDRSENKAEPFDDDSDIPF